MLERRRRLGGPLPQRRADPTPVELPGDEMYAELKQGSGKQAIATTMAFVRLLRDLMKDPEIGQRFVPIAPDEYRTFGMDSMFPTQKIYNPHGQQYDGVDRAMLLAYKESAQGQMLHEGISEAGCDGLDDRGRDGVRDARRAMIPVYIFYSMFGFQRTGDSIWAYGRPARARLPDRCHRRANDADRRGPAARRRALARSSRRRTRRCALRPGLRLRDRAHRAGRPARGCTARPTSTRTARTSSSTSPSTTSRPSSPPSRRTSMSRASSRASTTCRRLTPATATRAAHPAARVRCRRPVGHQGPADARRGVGRAGRRLVGDVVERAGPRCGRGRRVEPAAPRATSSGRHTSPQARPTPTGPCVAVSDYMRAVPDQIAQLGAGGLARRSAPTASASPTPGRGPAVLPHRR